MEEDEEDEYDEDDDYDEEEDDDFDDEFIDSELEGGEGLLLIYVLNLVNIKYDKMVKCGVVVKVMVICIWYLFLYIYKVCDFLGVLRIMKYILISISFFYY